MEHRLLLYFLSIMKVVDWYPLILSLTLVFSACNNNKEQTEEQEVREIPVTELVSSSTDLHRSYVADINAFRNVQIISHQLNFG